MPPTDESSASTDLRRLLLDAAREILQEPDTPLELRKVAERAGKSRTAPYLVFGKESEGGGLLGLKIAVAAEGASEMADRMEAAERSEPSDPLEAFQAVAEAFLLFVEENRRLFRLMYGPEIGALPTLGEDAFLQNAEVQRLLRHRDGAGTVVARIIRRGQEAGFFSPDPPGDLGKPYEQTPSDRRLQIAWATMIGVALLRDDELLRAIHWHIDRSQGARLIVESVFGLDPRVVQEAAAPYLESWASEHGAESDAPPAALAMEEATEEALGESPEDGTTWAMEESMGIPDGLVMRSSMPRSPLPGPDDDDVGPFPAPPDDLDLEDLEFLGVRQGGPQHAPMGGPPSSPPSSRRPRATPAVQSDLFPGEQKELPLESGGREVNLSETLARHSGLARAARSHTLMTRARILWIDDHPDRIAKGVETLERLGARVTVAETTAEATRVLRSGPAPNGPPFEVIISDIARGSRPDAGVRALPDLKRLAPDAAVIFFVGKLDPDRGPPKGAVGITNRTNELLHLVMDALEGR